jgi:hypothetical protein
MDTLLTEITGDSLFYQSRVIFRESGLRQIRRPDTASDPAKDMRREHHDGPNQRQRTSHGNTDDSERQQEQPYDRIQNQRDQCNWPAKNEEHAPNQKTQHTSLNIQPKIRSNAALRSSHFVTIRVATMREMKLFVIILLLACSLPAQTQRRRVISPSKAVENLDGLLVTFHGKLVEISKKEITIETEDQPIFNIGRSGKTKFLKDGKAIKPDTIPVGALLTVDVVKDPDLNPLAVNVNVDPPAKPAQ